MLEVFGVECDPQVALFGGPFDFFLEKFGGFGDLGEDEGERGHQMGALNESRSKSLRDNAAKAAAHAAWKEMLKDPRVVAHKVNVEEGAKRKRKGDAQLTAKQLKKIDRDGWRESLLGIEVLTGKMETLRQERKRKILERLPKRDFSVWSIGNQWSKERDLWAYPPIKITARQKKG